MNSILTQRLFIDYIGDGTIILLAIFILGIFAGAISGVAGGGSGLISITGLLLLGVPANIAVATNRSAAIGAILTSTYKFFNEKQIKVKYLVPLTILSIIGSAVGSSLLSTINQVFLSKILTVCIIIVAILSFLKPRFGLEEKKTTRSARLIGYLLYGLTIIYGGVISAGGGIFTIYILTGIFGLTYLQANATDKIAAIFSIIVSIIIYAVNGLINYKIGLTLLIGMSIGGYIGAHIAIKKGNEFVKLAFSIMVIILACKLLYFGF